jgi:hypothetical protein
VERGNHQAWTAAYLQHRASCGLETSPAGDPEAIESAENAGDEPSIATITCRIILI